MRIPVPVGSRRRPHWSFVLAIRWIINSIRGLDPDRDCIDLKRTPDTKLPRRESNPHQLVRSDILEAGLHPSGASEKLGNLGSPGGHGGRLWLAAEFLTRLGVIELLHNFA
jgi:hypothetical protein